MFRSEEVEPHSGDKRYVRRDEKGQFKTEVDEGRSLAADRRHKAMKPSQDTATAAIARRARPWQAHIAPSPSTPVAVI